MISSLRSILRGFFIQSLTRSDWETQTYIGMFSHLLAVISSSSHSESHSPSSQSANTQLVTSASGRSWISNFHTEEIFSVPGRSADRGESLRQTLIGEGGRRRGRLIHDIHVGKHQVNLVLLLLLCLGLLQSLPYTPPTKPLHCQSLRTTGVVFSLSVPVVVHPVVEGVGLPLDVVHLLPVVQPVLVALEGGGQTEGDLERKTVNPAVVLLAPRKGLSEGLRSVVDMNTFSVLSHPDCPALEYFDIDRPGHHWSCDGFSW